MKPFVPCQTCESTKPLRGAGGSEPYVRPPDGYYYVEKDGGTFLRECECHQKWALNNLMYIKAGKANLWTDERAIDYDPIKDHVGKKDIDNVSELRKNLYQLLDGKCFYITGSFCTQKTTLAQWIGLEVFRQGYAAYYENMHNFITNLVPMGFNDLDKHKAYYDKVLDVDVLILDNVFDKGRTKIQDFQFPYIESTLRDRIEQKQKGTIFVTDLAVPNGIETTSLYAFIKKATNGFTLTLRDSTLHVSVDEVFGKK